LRTNTGRIISLALGIYALDQLTKYLVLMFLPEPNRSEIHVLPGFFKLVHWHNTGAAWSMFSENNALLSIISAVALVVLFLIRRKFGSDTFLGWLALGLMLGGIAGNLTDRVMPSRRHVIDFLYFHLFTRSGNEIGFPAFNVADSAICIGVGLLFIVSWRADQKAAAADEKPA
jgi:signal peptidase II